MPELTEQLRTLVGNALNPDITELSAEDIIRFITVSLSDLDLEQYSPEQTPIVSTEEDGKTIVPVYNVYNNPVLAADTQPPNVFYVSPDFNAGEYQRYKIYSNFHDAFTDATEGTLIRVFPGNYEITEALEVKTRVYVHCERGAVFDITLPNVTYTAFIYGFLASGDLFWWSGNAEFVLNGEKGLLDIDSFAVSNAFFEFAKITNFSGSSRSVSIAGMVESIVKGEVYKSTALRDPEDVEIFTNLSFPDPYIFMPSLLEVKRVETIKTFYDSEDHFQNGSFILRNMYVEKTGEDGDAVIGSQHIQGDDSNCVWIFDSVVVNRVTITTPYPPYAIFCTTSGIIAVNTICFVANENVACIYSSTVNSPIMFLGVLANTNYDRLIPEVTVRGLCWSTNVLPTIADDKTENGTDIGVFVAEMTGLLPNTTYYVRAYAINQAGVSYGDQLTFETE